MLWVLKQPLLSPESTHITALFQYALVFALAVALAFRLRNSPQPKRWLVAFAFLPPLVALFHPPSDDVFRYLWEGFVAAEGNNPYVLPPEFFEGTTIAQQFPHYDGINNRDKTAIYGGFYLFLMKVLALAGGSTTTLTLYRGLVGLAGMWAAFVLLRLVQLRQGDGNEWKTALFLLNPVWVLWTLGELHLDVLWTALLLTALLLREQAKTATPRRKVALQLAMMACFWAAVHVKFPAILLLPFFLGTWPWGLTAHAATAILGFGLFVAPYAGDGLANLWASARMFATTMSTNASPIHRTLLDVFDGKHHYLWASFGLVYAWLTLTKANALRTTFWMWLAFLWFSPTIHPWYLALLLALNVFVHAKSLWLWSLLIGGALLTFRTSLASGSWNEIEDIRLWTYGVVFSAVAVEFLWTRFFPKFEAMTKATCSVVIPTLNEERTLPGCLGALRKAVAVAGAETELLLADGGSTDQTIALAKKEGLRIVRATAGRGAQIAAATNQAQGNLIIVLHSDVLLSEGALQRTIKAFQRDRRLAMVSHSMSFDEQKKADRKMKWIRRLNDLRASVAKVSFGDQTQSFRRTALEKIGGFPNRKLFEDVELALRMRACGKVRHLKANGGKASLRHWKTGQRIQRVGFILFLCAAYTLGRMIGWDQDGNALYRLYYKGKSLFN